VDLRQIIEGFYGLCLVHRGVIGIIFGLLHSGFERRLPKFSCSRAEL